MPDDIWIVHASLECSSRLMDNLVVIDTVPLLLTNMCLINYSVMVYIHSHYYLISVWYRVVESLWGARVSWAWGIFLCLFVVNFYLSGSCCKQKDTSEKKRRRRLIKRQTGVLQIYYSVWLKLCLDVTKFAKKFMGFLWNAFISTVPWKVKG